MQSTLKIKLRYRFFGMISGAIFAFKYQPRNISTETKAISLFELAKMKLSDGQTVLMKFKVNI